MKKYSIIKRIYGTEINQVNPKTYNTKEEATKDAKSWENENTSWGGIIQGRNFEVI